VFAAVRHPDVPNLGVISHGTLDALRVIGWFRVSPWRETAGEVRLAELADCYIDLDAATPEPQEEDETESPAEPEKEESA
jgi:hypothetical protein